MAVTERLFTIPITCCFDRRAHEATDENAVLVTSRSPQDPTRRGRHRRPGWLWRIPAPGPHHQGPIAGK